MLAVVWWIPESPRYYISKDQPEKGLRILAYYHAEGNEADEIVQLEFTEITTAIAMEKNSEHSSSYMDFLRTPGNRKRLLIIASFGLFAQWSGNGLVSYYLNLIMDSIGIRDANKQLLINGALTSFNLVTNVFFSFFRRQLGQATDHAGKFGGNACLFCDLDSIVSEIRRTCQLKSRVWRPGNDLHILPVLQP